MTKTRTGYWNKYYKSLRQDNKESNFAKFIKKKLVNKNDIILDVATGDGRDAFFFSKFSKTVYGIDESKVVIKLNNKKTKAQKINNLTFLNVKSEKIKNLSKKKISLIYARFFIHAIKERTENKFLDDIKKYFDKNTIVALEFRTTKDKLIKKGTKIGKNERLVTWIKPKKKPKTVSILPIPEYLTVFDIPLFIINIIKITKINKPIPKAKSSIY